MSVWIALAVSLGCSTGAPDIEPRWPPPRPTLAQLETTTDASSDVEAGLDAKKWKFRSFFNRVKAGVQKHWRPREVWLSLPPEEKVEKKWFYTALDVSLDRTGGLVFASVGLSSGVPALDEGAIMAFRAASPFRSPPVQLLDDDELVQFRFGFLFQVLDRANGGRGAFRGTRAAGDATRSEPIRRYRRRLQAAIEERWRATEHPEVSTATPPATTLRIGISPEGKLTSIELVTSSGTPELDQSWRGAVRSAAPFEPIPQDLRGWLVDGVVLTFRPVARAESPAREVPGTFPVPEVPGTSP